MTPERWAILLRLSFWSEQGLNLVGQRLVLEALGFSTDDSLDFLADWLIVTSGARPPLPVDWRKANA